MSAVMASRPKHAEPRPQPRLVLITPAVADAAAFAPVLEDALAAADVAAVVLRLAPGDERERINRVKRLAPVCQAREIALLLDGDVDLIARGGADGAHLTGIDAFSDALERLKPDRIAGCGGLKTRHDAMLAAERGADYVMFGEPDARGARAPFPAIEERVTWWQEVFETPCVAYAAAPEEVALLAVAGADFVLLGEWAWVNPAANIRAAADALRLPERAA
jgi:thiamine-phosphate pyrophosphorylase